MFKNQDGHLTDFELPTYSKTENNLDWAVACVRVGSNKQLEISRLQ